MKSWLKTLKTLRPERSAMVKLVGTQGLVARVNAIATDAGQQLDS